MLALVSRWLSGELPLARETIGAWITACDVMLDS